VPHKFVRAVQPQRRAINTGIDTIHHEIVIALVDAG
jgi:hypothetical protein